MRARLVCAMSRRGDALNARERRAHIALISARAGLTQAEEDWRECLQGYAKRRPLTPKEKKALVARVAAGEPLCCEEGLQWLTETVPPIWAEAINAWAYERLSCREPERIPELVKRVQALRRDVLPSDPYR